MDGLRNKGQGFIARARRTPDPAHRRRLLATGRATLARARAADAAQYAALVGRANVTLAGYRAWQSTRRRSA